MFANNFTLHTFAIASILHKFVIMFAQQKKIRHIFVCATEKNLAFVSAMSHDSKKGLPFQVSMFAKNYILHTFAEQTFAFAKIC
jgi:hypothetical protein